MLGLAVGNLGDFVSAGWGRLCCGHQADKSSTWLLNAGCCSVPAQSWDLLMHSPAARLGCRGRPRTQLAPANYLLSPHSYAVIAYGFAECPRLTCGREGCGTEFCYHCRQPWHPDGPCAAAPLASSLASPSAQLVYTEESANGETSSRMGMWGFDTSE